MFIEYAEKEPSPHIVDGVGGFEKRWWRSFNDRINPGRDYYMFSRLANMGRGSEMPLFANRGWSEDIGYYAKDYNLVYITEDAGAYSDGNYVTPERAAEWLKYGSEYVNDSNGKPTWVTNPDLHSHSWLTVDEFQQVIDGYVADYPDTDSQWAPTKPPTAYVALLAAMRALEDDGANDVRIVFCFDN